MTPHRNAMCFVHHYHRKVQFTCGFQPFRAFLSFGGDVQNLNPPFFGFGNDIGILFVGLSAINAFGGDTK